MVKITDFGLAKHQSFNTQDGKIEKHSDDKGTTLYWSPEQSRREAYNYKVDIYALGLILFAMLNSKHPNPQEVFQNIREGVTQPQVPQHAEEFSELLRSMLSQRPKDRPDALQIVRACRALHRNFQKKIDNNEPKSTRQLGQEPKKPFKHGAHLKQKRLNKVARK